MIKLTNLCNNSFGSNKVEIVFTLHLLTWQGWFELASARHSMGASRINSALFDLKYHSAATTLQLNNLDGKSIPFLQHLCILLVGTQNYLYHVHSVVELLFCWFT